MGMEKYLKNLHIHEHDHHREQIRPGPFNELIVADIIRLRIIEIEPRIGEITEGMRVFETSLQNRQRKERGSSSNSAADNVIEQPGNYKKKGVHDREQHTTHHEEWIDLAHRLPSADPI